MDFFGGQRDIKDNVIRVLHTLSFVEDPTRCLRAVRFEQRYGFHLGKNTEKLIRNAIALKVLDRLKHQRSLYEFMQICAEADPVACILRLENLGILKALLPKTTLTKTRRKLLEKIKQYITWYNMLYQQDPIHPWILYLWGLNHGLSFGDAKSNMQLLHISQQNLDYILARRTQMQFICLNAERWCREQNEQPKISVLYELLHKVEIDALIYIMATNKEEKLSPFLSNYVTQGRKVNADIRGRDLLELGIQPGPLFTIILKRVLWAKLDGEVSDKASQLALAQELASQAESLLQSYGPTKGRKKAKAKSTETSSMAKD